MPGVTSECVNFVHFRKIVQLDIEVPIDLARALLITTVMVAAQVR